VFALRSAGFGRSVRAAAAYIFGEGVRPILAKRGLLGEGAAAAGPAEPVRSAFLPRIGDVSAS
jgi:alkanesulfonate monooxygenase